MRALSILVCLVGCSVVFDPDTHNGDAGLPDALGDVSARRRTREAILPEELCSVIARPYCESKAACCEQRSRRRTFRRASSSSMVSCSDYDRHVRARPATAIQRGGGAGRARRVPRDHGHVRRRCHARALRRIILERGRWDHSGRSDLHADARGRHPSGVVRRLRVSERRPLQSRGPAAIRVGMEVLASHTSNASVPSDVTPARSRARSPLAERRLLLSAAADCQSGLLPSNQHRVAMAPVRARWSIASATHATDGRCLLRTRPRVRGDSERDDARRLTCPIGMLGSRGDRATHGRAGGDRPRRHGDRRRPRRRLRGLRTAGCRRDGR